MADKTKLKARLPRGLIDRGPADVAATETMLAAIKRQFELFGFEPVETPFIEYTDALGKFLPDQDRPNEGVFSFQDDDEQWLSLRYDLTAPLARYVAENFDALPKPYRSYRAGYVFRNEKPGPGRFRQFMQFDADIVGAASVAADAEACMLMADTLEAVGIKRGDYVIKVNNRKVLDGVLEAIGLGGEENAGRRLGVLRAIDKLDKFGPEGVRLLLTVGRWDGVEVGKGDFTKGVGLNASDADYVLNYCTTDVHSDVSVDPDMIDAASLRGDVVEVYSDNRRYSETLIIDNSQTIRKLRQAVGGRAAVDVAIAELESISNLCAAAGYGTARICIDPSIVRGLEYYTGPVFEAELTFPVTNEDGQVVRFGSVAGGGRYDGLVGRFRNEPVPATGFSIGVSRLYTALKLTNSPLLAGAARRGPVVVTVMDKDRTADYQRMVASLRAAGVAAELYLGSSGFNAQMKYADKRRSPCVVIQGSSEKEAGQVQVKDLILGAELAALGREGKDREDYLERQKQAQFAVAEEDLVAAVQQVLARYA
jgi:histidyl-tRNA synthetase